MSRPAGVKSDYGTLARRDGLDGMRAVESGPQSVPKGKRESESRRGEGFFFSLWSAVRGLDRLDGWSVVVITILGVAVIFLLFTTKAEEPPDKAGQLRRTESATRVEAHPDFVNRLKIAKDLLSNNSLDQAGEIIATLVRDNPYDGTVHLLSADLHWYRQDPVKAMEQYRQAVDLNPDFLDKKAEVFQGKKIKRVMEEAERALQTLETKEGVTETVKAYRKVFHYMQRRLAGSCG